MPEHDSVTHEVGTPPAAAPALMATSGSGISSPAAPVCVRLEMLITP